MLGRRPHRVSSLSSRTAILLAGPPGPGYVSHGLGSRGPGARALTSLTVAHTVFYLDHRC